MYDATHNQSFGLGLTAMNEVRKRIVSMTYDIMFFFYQWLHIQETFNI